MMNTKVTIQLDSVSVYYPLSANEHKQFPLNLLHNFKRKKYWALHNISLTLNEGDCLGIVGKNGAGKSTVARVLAGILPPDCGQVRINGQTRILSLSAHLVRTLTGRENIRLAAGYLGIRKSAARSFEQEIIEFSGVGDFIDQPLRTYSSGMRSRLAFAIATAQSSDIMIIDEALSTGDAEFQKKAEARLSSLLQHSKIVILISHRLSWLKKCATRGILLEKGKITMDDSIENVIGAYCNEDQKAVVS